MGEGMTEYEMMKNKRQDEGMVGDKTKGWWETR